jgi:mRNA interferase MazF
VALGRLPCLHESSYANTQGLGSLPTVRLERRIGILPAGTLVKIQDALRFTLGL